MDVDFAMVRLIQALGEMVHSYPTPEVKRTFDVVRNYVDGAPTEPLWGPVDHYWSMRGLVPWNFFSAEEVRSKIRQHSGCEQVPVFSNHEVFVELRGLLKEAFVPLEVLLEHPNDAESAVARRLAKRAGLEWSGHDVEADWSALKAESSEGRDQDD